MLVTDLMLRKVSVAVSLAGIVFLLVFLRFFEPQETGIESISDALIGRDVLVKGIAKNVFFTKNTLLFEVFGPAKIRAVKFSPSKSELETIKETAFLEITGSVQKYEGELEIVVKSVRKIG